MCSLAALDWSNGTRLQYVTQAARSACGLSDLIKVGPFGAAIYQHVQNDVTLTFPDQACKIAEVYSS